MTDIVARKMKMHCSEYAMQKVRTVLRSGLALPDNDNGQERK